MVTIKLKNSQVKDKTPQPGDLDVGGELAVNHHADNPGIFLKDTAGVVRKIAGTGAVGATDATTTAKGVVQLADAAAVTAGTAGRVVDAAGLKAAIDAALQPGTSTPPAAPSTGDTYIDTATTPAVINVWNGTAWVPQAGTAVTGGTAPSTPATGQIWVDTSGATPATKIWDGTAWVSMTVDTATQAKIDGQVAGLWTRTGTVVSPTTAGDTMQISAGTAALPGLTPVGDPDTGVYASAANEIGLAAKGVGQIIATENGVKLPYLIGTQVGNLIVDATGLVKRQALPFSWDANDDSYVRTAVADRNILVQARMKRCLVTDAGAVTYLDADDSTKLAGDWVRLVETSELDTAYTGTHQAEVANTELRSLATAWTASTFTKGALVTNGGFVWECVAATTTATPAAGTAAATIDGTAGQVMVEIPAFSVKHDSLQVGTYKRHELAVAPGAITSGGFVVHPAFVKPDGTVRDFIYVGAYQGTGTNGNGSASGVNNAANFYRSACRNACAGRGTGWHQLGYWDYNALQWLLITEYQDMNSQRVLGNGAMTGGVFSVATGLSNARGNRSANAHTPAGANSDYVSYRGVENLYGRAWQWVDGININERNAYLCADASKWADDTAANYAPSGTVPSGSGSYQRDVMSGVALLPSSVVGASDKTYVGDGLWTGFGGWRPGYVGGDASIGGRVGALCVRLLYSGSAYASPSIGGRLVYAA